MPILAKAFTPVASLGDFKSVHPWRIFPLLSIDRKSEAERKEGRQNAYNPRNPVCVISSVRDHELRPPCAARKLVRHQPRIYPIGDRSER